MRHFINENCLSTGSQIISLYFQPFPSQKYLPPLFLYPSISPHTREKGSRELVNVETIASLFIENKRGKQMEIDQTLVVSQLFPIYFLKTNMPLMATMR